MALLVVLIGFILAQECLFLMYYAIKSGYTQTAAWLTAAVAMAQAVIGTGVTGYFSIVKVDHKEGGITFETAKANSFTEENTESPNI